MIEEWVMIAAEIKKEEMVEVAEEFSFKIYMEVMKHLDDIKNHCPDLTDVTNKIENLFLLKTRSDVSAIFDKTLSDGIELGKRIR
ncbi:hypothetical protein D3C75_773770 [compost metagenome]